jgi:hypothetical protein
MSKQLNILNVNKINSKAQSTIEEKCAIKISCNGRAYKFASKMHELNRINLLFTFCCPQRKIYYEEIKIIYY